jgi:hypothetical protein
MMLGNVNYSIFQNTYDTGLKVSDQGRITNIAMIMENDIRKVGYCSDYTKPVDPKNCILLADTSKIKFVYDSDMNGTLDTFYYYLGPKTELPNTPNPDDCYLYKKINSQTPVKISDGVTKLNFNYYDASDTKLAAPVSDRTLIKSIELSVVIEPGSPVKRPEVWGGDPYPAISIRETRVTARNLLTR